MKQKLLLLIGLSSTIYATQEISCIDFVNLQKNEAKSYLDNYRKEFELNHFKTKNHTDTDKQYIGMQGGISRHLLTCINLRRITYYDIEDVRRALILTSLSKKNLNQEEQNIYQESLSNNIAFYSKYSNSSLFNVQYMPLVYLTIQRSKDRQHYIVYEFRKNGLTIERYSKQISISNPYIEFDTKNNIENQNYLTYLNENSIKPQLRIFKEPILKQSHPIKTIKSIPLPSKVDDTEYSVINSFEAIKISDNETYSITEEFYPIKVKETKDKVYFLIGDEEYYISKRWWKRGTQKVGEIQ